MLAATNWNEWVGVGTLTLAAVTVILACVSAAGVVVAARAAKDTRRLTEIAEKEVRAVLAQAEATQAQTRATSEQAEAARAALAVSVQPLLGHLPVGEFSSEHPNAEIGAVDVGGDEDRLWISVPLRNVGAGVALIQRAYLTYDDPDARSLVGDVSSTMVPVGELTRFGFTIDRDERPDLVDRFDSALWLEVLYSDGSGAQPTRSRAVVRETSYKIFEVTRVYLYRGDEGEPFATAGLPLRY